MTNETADPVLSSLLEDAESVLTAEDLKMIAKRLRNPGAHWLMSRYLSVPPESTTVLAYRHDGRDIEPGTLTGTGER